MYKGKQVVQYRLHWWRHHVFPWGWFSIAHDKFSDDQVFADGCYRPNDGGGGIWSQDKRLYTADGFHPTAGFVAGSDDGGEVLIIDDGGRWVKPPNLELTGGAPADTTKRPA